MLGTAHGAVTAEQGEKLDQVCMTSVASYHEPEHVLALAMEAASDAESHVLLLIGEWAEIVILCNLFAASARAHSVFVNLDSWCADAVQQASFRPRFVICREN